MDEAIQTLLNGYQDPTILSSIETGTIAFCNHAAQKELGLSWDQLKGNSLYDYFKDQQIIRKNVIWKYDQRHFEVNEEKIVLSDRSFIKASLKPVDDSHFLDLLEVQREMAKLLVHRFHSPLNGISGFLELLQGLDLDDQQQRYASKIGEGVDDLKHILNRIKKLAQQVEVQYSNINTEAFVQNIIEGYNTTEQKRINLTIDEGVTGIRSDVVLLGTIITELLDNAFAFSSSPHDSVELHFTDQQTIRITNYGVPIQEAYIEKMFYPFYSNKARGIGLGLTQCVLYAEELNYDIVLAENSKAQGITFEIRMA